VLAAAASGRDIGVAARSVQPAAAVRNAASPDPPRRTPRPAPTALPTPNPTAPPTAPPQSTAPPTAAAVTVPVNVGAVFAVGDSVTIDIAAALQRAVAGVTVDGKVGRQFSAGVDIVDQLRGAGRLAQTVVVALGTNGTVTPAEFDAMMHAAAGVQRVVFVTVHVPRTWENEVNSTLHAGVARYPDTALADWHALSAGHPEWFAPDGYHLTQPGAQALAQLIASVLAS
jgi:hypothetical protein